MEDEQALAQTPSFVRTLLLHPPAVPSQRTFPPLAALVRPELKSMSSSNSVGTTMT